MHLTLHSCAPTLIRAPTRCSRAHGHGVHVLAVREQQSLGGGAHAFVVVKCAAVDGVGNLVHGVLIMLPRGKDEPAAQYVERGAAHERVIIIQSRQDHVDL